MTKAIFFDVDGTLVSFRTHQISDAVLDALHRLRAKGIKLFVSTGRHSIMLAQLRALFPFDGWITLSGQHCTCDGQVIYSNPIQRPAVEQLVAATQDNDFSCIFLESDDIYINRIDQSAQAFTQKLDLPLPPVQHPRRALDGRLYQAIALLTQEQDGLLLGQAPLLKTTRWHPNFLDVLPASGGKDKGVDAMLAHFDIPLEDSMAFGDGENDLTMLAHVGIGVAMGSASDAVKAAADHTTGTVDEDGILSALVKFGLL